jgi:hypothetical protein
MLMVCLAAEDDRSHGSYETHGTYTSHKSYQTYLNAPTIPSPLPSHQPIKSSSPPPLPLDGKAP